MNKDKIKQLRDALAVIKAECASHGIRCPQSCPFHNGEGECGICTESPSNWELNSDSFFEWHAFT